MISESEWSYNDNNKNKNKITESDWVSENKRLRGSDEKYINKWNNSTSSFVSFSPMVVKTWRNSGTEMNPLLFLSNTLKASLISSSLSECLNFLCINPKNCWKSTNPDPSSTSLIRSLSSACVGFWPVVKILMINK